MYILGSFEAFIYHTLHAFLRQHLNRKHPKNKTGRGWACTVKKG
jgi:hypothetical protein